MCRYIKLLLCVAITTTQLTVTLGTPPAASNLQGCECWKWPDCSRNCTGNNLLKSVLQTEQKLLSSLPLPFSLMFPYQDRRNRIKYGTSTSGKRGTYHASTTFWVHLPTNPRTQLLIQKSRIFSGLDTESILYYQKTNTGQIQPYPSNLPDHCFYTGSVELEHDVQSVGTSYVAVDTCHGLRGLIYLSNRTFGVFPLGCSACQPDLHPHVVFRLLPSTISRDYSNISLFWRPTDVLSQKSPRVRKPEDATYLIRIKIIVDHQTFVAFQRKMDQSLHYVTSVFNQATKSFINLPIELRLSRVEIWNIQDKINVTANIKTTLNQLANYTIGRAEEDNESSGNVKFNRWKRQVISAAEKPSHARSDVTMLLTSNKFANALEYMAVPDSVCTPRSLAIVRINLSETAYHTSRLVTLAIAEILGMRSFPCPPRYRCFTDDDLLSQGDKARIRLALFAGLSDCLIMNNERPEDFRVDTCGDGKLDRGEECDPGHVLQHRSMPCCNRVTCLADEGAECTHGACCEACRLATRGHVCRHAQDQCDLPEFCTGDQQSTCPPDLYLENGSPCHPHLTNQPNPRTQTIVHLPSSVITVDESTALCYRGRCPTRDSQCQFIWGPTSNKAEDYCFMLHNTKTAGACGVSGENCPTGDEMCGLLHCQGGEDRPVSEAAQMGQPFRTYTEHNGKQFECKHLSHHSAVRFVPEGAACARNRFCFQQQCVSPHVGLRSKCSAALAQDGMKTSENDTCSNRGLCTNGGFCLCIPGWTGDACELPESTTLLRHEAKSDFVPIGSVPEPDMETKLRIWTYMERLRRGDNLVVSDRSMEQSNSLRLAIVIGSVVGAIFIATALFLLIYRRGFVSFSRKPSRSHCFPLSRRVLPSAVSAYNQRRSNSKHSHVTDSIDLKYTALLANQHHLAEDVSLQLGERSGARRKREHPRSRHRRPRHGKRREYEGDVPDCTRWAKYSDGSPVRDWRQLMELGAMNHSDTELAFTTGRWFEEGNDSIERMITFGSMPSYRADKLQRNKGPIQRSSSQSLNANCSTPISRPIANIACVASSVTADINETAARSNHPHPLMSPLLSRSSHVTTPPSNEASCKSEVPGFSSAVSTEQWKTKSTAETVSSNLNENDNEGIDVLKSPLTVEMDCSWRHPEKGILKNKHEISGSKRTHRSTHHSIDHSRRPRRHHRHHHHRGCKAEMEHESSSPCSKCFRKKRTRCHRHQVLQQTHLEGGSSQVASTSGSSSTASSHSSYSFPFSDVKDTRRSISSTSSSTTSTCSTALEVGPEGNGGPFRSRTKLAGKKDRSRKNYKEFHSSDEEQLLKDGCKSSHRPTRGANRTRVIRHGFDDSNLDNHHSANSTNAPALSESTGTPSFSGASSSSSSAGRHFHHRRRRRIRCHDSTDEGANSGSRQGTPPVPTILCNAGQQTDEQGFITNPDNDTSPANRRPSKTTSDESEGEWEEIECNESACEECQHAFIIKPTRNANETTSKPPSTARHTNPAYVIPSKLDSFGAVGFHQSTASTSLTNSTKTSRIGTSTTQPSNVHGISRGGIANQAASGSSCSSSSVANQTAIPTIRPPVLPGRVVTEANSVTQNDSRLEANLPQSHLLLHSQQTQQQQQQRRLYTPISASPYNVKPQRATVEARNSLPLSQPGDTNNQGPRNAPYFAQRAENYYQHPYEEVAADDYLEARLSQQRVPAAAAAHIYHQHGSINNAGTQNGNSYEQQADEEDDNLSLDEGSSYPRRLDDGCESRADGSDFRDVHRSGTRVVPGFASSGNQYQLLTHTEPQSLNQMLMNTFQADATIPSQLCQQQNPAPLSRDTNHTHDLDGCSNDGSCDGSDASSLPEVGCDLIQLARLELPAGRSNRILNELAKKHHSIRSNVSWIPGSNG